MKETLENFIGKCNKMMNYIKKEYQKIIENYSDEELYIKCIPLRIPTKFDYQKQIEMKKQIDKIFNPEINRIKELIEKGLVVWDKPQKWLKTPLKVTPLNAKELTEKAIYESLDRLYILIHIKYNIMLNFILQLYLFFERELNIFLIDDNVPNDGNLFKNIRRLEKKYNIKIDDNLKKNIDLYKDIINVHKHGNGDSFNKILAKRKDILNVTEIYNNDSAFAFNTKKVNFESFYNIINMLLEDISQKII